jgi:transposase-like protein
MLKMVSQMFLDEVEALCGPRYQHHREAQAWRGGHEQGSIYWAGQRQAVERPRVRNQKGEVHLESYGALRDYDLFSKEVQDLLLRGVSTRDYSDLVRKVDEDLGLSKSSASRAFVRASQKDLDAINGRDLAGEVYCALMIDGLEENGRHYVCVLGFTTQGHKKILGLREGATENSEVVTDLLASLIERHLSTTVHVLFVIDGAKALRKAITAQWGSRAVIQRCQEHKIRNVGSYVPDHLQAEVERRMRAAYAMNSYDQAWTALQKLLRWLREHNDAAAKSLAEGLEETLAVHRLDLPPLLRQTFRSTNPIESMFDKVRSRTRRVKNWRGRNQFARWASSALLLHEKRFNRIKGHKQLYKLLVALENLSVDKKTEVA